MTSGSDIPSGRNTDAELFFDETEVRAAVPFEVRRTSIPGVYDIPVPPPDFDPRTATAEELRRAGLPWRRSVINRNLITRELWDRATARRYTPVDETVTTFGPPPGLELPRRGVPNSNSGYNTWSGSVVLTGETWTGIEGQWVVPTALPGAQHATTSSRGDKKYKGWWMSSWVGHGGWLYTGSDNVLQIGIQQFVGQVGKDGKDWKEHTSTYLSGTSGGIRALPRISPHTAPRYPYIASTCSPETRSLPPFPTSEVRLARSG